MRARLYQYHVLNIASKFNVLINHQKTNGKFPNTDRRINLNLDKRKLWVKVNSILIWIRHYSLSRRQRTHTNHMANRCVRSGLFLRIDVEWISLNRLRHLKLYFCWARTSFLCRAYKVYCCTLIVQAARSALRYIGHCITQWIKQTNET